LEQTAYGAIGAHICR